MSKVKRERGDGRAIWILVASAATVFIIVFFAARGRFETPLSGPAVITLLAPFQRAASWAGEKAEGMAAAVEDIMSVHEQNKLLRIEVEELRMQNVRANEYVAENIRLRELLGYRQSATQFDLTAARVIGRESATWTRMIVIDCGTQQGVRKDMPVVTARGLVGVVTEAGPISSKVELILDPRSSAGTLVQRSRVAGIVVGDPNDAMHPRMVNIPRSEDVAAGDMIVTSGFGGIYPKGMIVGTVTSVKDDSGGLLQYAVIEPAVDFQRLEDVAVITASREAPPEPLPPPRQTPGTETDPRAAIAAREAAERAAQGQQPAPPPATAQAAPQESARPEPRQTPARPQGQTGEQARPAAGQVHAPAPAPPPAAAPSPAAQGTAANTGAAR